MGPLTPTTKREIVRKLGWMMIPGAVLAWLTRNQVLVVTLLGLLVLNLLLGYGWWRCDVCGRWLGEIGNPRFCPRCGHQLR